MFRILLITILVVFVLNFGKASGFTDIAAAKSSPSCSSSIVPIIDISKEAKVVDFSLFIRPYKRIFDTKRVGNTFAACNSFFNKHGVVIRRDGERFIKPFKCHALFCDGRSASADIIYGIVKLMRYITASIELGSGIRFFQTNRMYPELWAVGSDKFLFGKLNAFFSGISGFLCGKPQKNITNNKKPCKNHQPTSISGYRIILNSTKLTVAIFLVTIFGGGIASMGVYLIDFGHRIWGGGIIIVFGIYIVFCAYLGIEFPWLHLPLSNWWMWLL